MDRWIKSYYRVEPSKPKISDIPTEWSIRDHYLIMSIITEYYHTPIFTHTYPHTHAYTLEEYKQTHLYVCIHKQTYSKNTYIHRNTYAYSDSNTHTHTHILTHIHRNTYIYNPPHTHTNHTRKSNFVFILLVIISKNNITRICKKKLRFCFWSSSNIATN